ncbi:MAG: NlpC/P60 family protein [Pseudomonadota bacterium]
MTSLAGGIDWGIYVGLPFGDGPDEVTCWSLIRLVFKDVRGTDLPPYGDISAYDLGRVARGMKAEAQSGRWSTVIDPAPLDVVLMRSARGSGPVCHVGLIAGVGMMLHAEENTGSALVALDHYTVKGRILGMRRFTA